MLKKIMILLRMMTIIMVVLVLWLWVQLILQSKEGQMLVEIQ